MKPLILTKWLAVGIIAGSLLACESAQQSSQSSIPSMPSSSSSSSTSSMPSMPSSGSSGPSSSMPTASAGGIPSSGMPSSSSSGIPSTSQGRDGVPGARTGQAGIPRAGSPSTGLPGGSAGLPSGGQRDSVGVSGDAEGDYSLDNLPGSSADGATGPLTAQERAAILAGTLNAGYEDFDGFILEERARAQAQANAARGPGTIGGGNSSAGGAGAGNSPIVTATGAVGAVGRASGVPGVNNRNNSATETFPPPQDIPSGRDDDIVARQLREAAMQESDPELREKLWDEYRKYTGIKQ